MNIEELFHQFSSKTSQLVGSAWAFTLATLIVLAWAVSGPLFQFNETWQLVINTGTTIVTFLMVFLIQNTQNRDTAAMQIKLDELIRSTRGAHNALLDLEEMEEQDLERLRMDYEDLAATARRDLKAGKSDTEIRETKQQRIDAQNQKGQRRTKS